MTQTPENPFWEFSVSVYGREGVAPACLRLQDQFGVDVNVLLYCCWIAAHRGAELDSAAMAQTMALTSPWRSGVVVPLRGIRRTLKASYDGYAANTQESLRTLVKRIELQAERLQQDALFATAKSIEQSPTNAAERREAAARNIIRYSETLKSPINGNGKNDIARILDAVFDEKDE